MLSYLVSMLSLRVRRSRLCGKIEVPPSKSQSIRALLYASLARGESCLENLLDSPDVEAMRRACRAIGARIEGHQVLGVAGVPHIPSDVIDVGNSGLVLRLIGALASLGNGYTVLTGDESIRSRRPAGPLIDGLRQLGAFAVSTRDNGLAPLVIGGNARAGVCSINGKDSQPVSAMLTLAALLEGETTIWVDQAGELPWIDLTLSWLRRLGVRIENEKYRAYRVRGGTIWSGFRYCAPGDFSSAAFPMVAALVTQGEIEIGNLAFDDPQGDKYLIDLLVQMGASIEKKKTSLMVHPSLTIRGQMIDMDLFIDAVPILAVLACFVEGETHLYNAEIARKKESDRIHSVCCELRKMGADIEELPAGLIVRKSSLIGARVRSHHDHRLAMALAVAGLGAQGETIVEEVECVHKTYPNFAASLGVLGANIEICAH